ncbi:hypothetical protein AB1Y20_015308 [Prymnesium parvum]|uniref:Sulfotransferase domain-containing protein n=1 Tax=Prymnesium parvum TaxID=97485 RepID=A0AB34K025_PRYPA
MACIAIAPANQNLCSTVRAPRLLPTLFVIGSLKAGSTSLWANLVDHTNGRITPGYLTHKGDVSRKEKDFFGDPSMWRLGRRWYEAIWPRCTKDDHKVAVDATPAYHVWYDAPKNMATFFGPKLPQLKLVWMMREPVSKFWSYFWELKQYGGEFQRMSFSQFLAPKLARAHACLEKDPNSPLWPPSLPPPFESCAPHLDHGLYHPQLVRWLQFFHPSQLLIISFAGFISQPSEVFHDVLIHAGLPRTEAKGAVERLQQAPATAHRKKMENSRAKGHGRMAAKSRAQLHEFYAPFIERLYGLLNDKHISVSPCREMGTRFLDPPENYSASVPWRDNANARPFGQVRWKTSATQFSLGSESAHSE